MKTKELSTAARNTLNHHYGGDALFFATKWLEHALVSNEHSLYVEEIVTPIVLQAAQAELKEQQAKREASHNSEENRKELVQHYKGNPINFAKKMLLGEMHWSDMPIVKEYLSPEVLEIAKWQLLNKDKL